MRTRDGQDTTGAVAAWDAAHARYLANDDRVHAVITWIDGSLRDAEAATERATAGDVRGPLDGVLVGLKDNIDTQDVRTTSGRAS